MQTQIVAFGSDGKPELVCRAPLTDGQPLVGDIIRIGVDSVFLVYRVLERSWTFRPAGEDALAMNLTVVVAPVGMEPNPEFAGRMEQKLDDKDAPGLFEENWSPKES